MKKSLEKKRAMRTFIGAGILIILFALSTIYLYSITLDNSYENLNIAVSKFSKGGSVDATYGYKGGLFVFIKNSSSKDFGYFYQKDSKWHIRRSILSTKYNLDNKYEVTTYYVKKPKYYFIKVESKKDNIETLSDPSESNFSVINIVEKDKPINIYFAGTTIPITTSYYVEINGEQYYLADYSNTKMIR